MNPYTTQKLKHKLNTESVKRLLIQYFVEKEVPTFDSLMYPAFIQDLPFKVPQLFNVVEVVPHCQTLSSITSEAKLGWNMFILGNQRMYLGETHHTNLLELAQTLKSGSMIADDKNATRQTTPRRVVHFITGVLGKLEGGYVNLEPGVSPVMTSDMMGSRMANQMSGANQFFTKSGYGT